MFCDLNLYRHTAGDRRLQLLVTGQCRSWLRAFCLLTDHAFIRIIYKASFAIYISVIILLSRYAWILNNAWKLWLTNFCHLLHTFKSRYSTTETCVKRNFGRTGSKFRACLRAYAHYWEPWMGHRVKSLLSYGSASHLIPGDTQAGMLSYLHDCRATIIVGQSPGFAARASRRRP